MSVYFALVDWVNDVTISDEDIAKRSHQHMIGSNLSHISNGTSSHHYDNYLLDVTHHVPTSAIARLTRDGHVLVGCGRWRFCLLNRYNFKHQNTHETHFRILLTVNHR